MTYSLAIRIIVAGLLSVTLVAALATLLPGQDYNYPQTNARVLPRETNPGFSGPPNERRGRDQQAHGQREYGRPYAETYVPGRQTERPDDPGPFDRFHQDQREFRYQPRPQQGPAPPAPPDLFEPGKVIAIVGEQYILAGEILGDINQMIEPYKDKLPAEEFNRQKQLLMQRMLPRLIETKMLFHEMIRNIPAENLPMIREKVGEQFDEKQLPVLIERAKVETAADLDKMLREFGTSIEKQRRAFVEQIIAREVVRQNINQDPEVSHQEMLAHYRENAKDYERPARVRWEELAVWHEDYNSKREAWQAVAEMGNRVLRGAAFSRVAREMSKGHSADNGGWHDWTVRGSLKSRKLDDALFSLPEGRLSQIIETEDGFHIVRVLDREQAGSVPFFKEQVRIKKKLQKDKVEVEQKEFIDRVRAGTRVWTIFDDAPPLDEVAEP